MTPNKNAIEHQVMQMVRARQALKASEGLHTPFFDMGFTPEQIAALYNAAERMYQVTLTEQDVGTISTPSHLASALHRLLTTSRVRH